MAESPSCQQFKTPCGLKDHPDKDTVQFAVIGDFGLKKDGQQPTCEQNVADFLKKLDDQYRFNFILTAGDDNYWNGAASTLDQNLGPYQWIINPANTLAEHRFFPTLGNHDWDGPKVKGKPYLDYFSYLKKYPGGDGRYYEREDPAGIVDLFALNANPTEPDGITPDKKQGQWLKQSLTKSQAAWKIVYFHQPPFATATHDPPEPEMDWPFRDWGASAVIMGHEHVYERIVRNGFPYFIDGLGGHPWIYNISNEDNCKPVEGSAARYNGGYGAMLGVADRESITFCFYNVAGTCVDTQTLNKGGKAR